MRMGECLLLLGRRSRFLLTLPTRQTLLIGDTR